MRTSAHENYENIFKPAHVVKQLLNSFGLVVVAEVAQFQECDFWKRQVMPKLVPPGSREHTQRFYLPN